MCFLLQERLKLRMVKVKKAAQPSHTPELDEQDNMEDILFLCTGHFIYVFHEHFLSDLKYYYHVMYCHPYIKYAVKEGPVL